MAIDLPKVFLFAAFLLPVLLFIVGLIRGRRIDAMNEVGLAFVGSIMIGILTGLFAVTFLDFTWRDFALTWAAGVVVIVLSLLNAYAVSRARTEFEARRVPSEPLREPDEGRGGPILISRGDDGADCAPEVFLDAGQSSGFSGGSGALTAIDFFLPVTVNMYQLDISFAVGSDRIDCTATSTAQLRPWYQWYGAFAGPAGFGAVFTSTKIREAEATASGVVACEEQSGTCVMSGVGNYDTSIDVECSAAVAVNVRPDANDPRKVQLEATGAVSFIGQNTLDSIKTELSGTGSASSSSTSQGTTTALSGSVSAGVSATIKLPKDAEEQKMVNRPVTFRCVGRKKTAGSAG